MKIISNILSFFLLAVLFTGCGLDNYEEPQSKLMGKVTYNGETLGLRGTSGSVQLQIYQDGYAKHDPVAVYVNQDGTFEAMLFDGEYKLVTRNNNGPWVNDRDTVLVNVKGTTDCEVEVTPYFTISNESISLSGNTVNASLSINKIVSTATVSSVMLLVSKTAFVDEGTYIARQNLTTGAIGASTLSLDLSNNTDVAKATQLYARIGVKATGADQAIYSDVVKIR
ncbi:MAG: DUF3823 domain-containing protein [Porphyromonadaceae bacterium]|nr:DUF3823 domain-containing protein [Porphyromonadaceae bacterium]